MHRRFRKILFWISGILLALLVIFILLYSYTDLVDKGILNIVNRLVDQGIEIRYSKLEGNLVGNIRLSDVTVATKTDTLRCPVIELKYSSLDLLKGKINIDYLLLQNPQIRINISNEKNARPEDASTPADLDSLFAGVDLSSLPSLSVTKLSVKEGKLIIHQPTEDNYISGLSLESSASVNSETLNFQLKYLQGFWENKDITLKKASFHFKGNKKRVVLNQLEILFDDARIFAHGEIELIPNLKFYMFADTSRIAVPFIRKISGQFPYQNGDLTFYGSYIGSPASFAGELSANGNLDSLSFKEASFKYQFRNKTLALKDVRISTNFGNVRGSARVSPEEKNSIVLSFRDVDLKKAGFSSVTTELNGRLNLNFNTWNLKRLSGSGDAMLTGLVYDKIRMDSLFFNLAANEGNWELKRGSRVVVQKASQFFVSGSMSRSRELNLELNTQNNILDTLSARLNLGDLGGAGSLQVEITGSLDNPNIAGYMLLDSLTYSPATVYGVEGRFNVSGMLKERTGYFTLDLSSGLISDILLTDGTMILNLRQNIVDIDSVSFYNNDNYVALTGQVIQSEKYTDIRFNSFEFLYENYLISASDTLEAFYRNDSLQIENFTLSARGNGEIEVRGLLNFSGNTGLAVYFKNIRLLPFNQFLKWKYQLSGLSEISVGISGRMDSLQVESSLDMQDLALDADTLGNLKADFTYDNRKLVIENFYFQHRENSSFSLKGNIIFPSQKNGQGAYLFTDDNKINCAADFNNIQISDYPFFKTFNFPVEGNFSGNLRLEGSLPNPSGNYLIKGENVRFREYDFPKFQLDGRLSPQKIILDYARINFMDTDISANGFKNIVWDVNHPEEIFSDERFSLLVSIQDDTVKFLNVFTPEVDMLTGKIDVNARLGGAIDNPRILDGNIDISGGTLYLSKIENPVSNIEFASVLKDSRLKITKGRAKLKGEVEDQNFFKRFTRFIFSPIRRLLFKTRNEGDVSFSGDVDLSAIDRPKLNLSVKANRAYVNYFLENTKILFSTKNMSVTGRDTLLVKGDVTIHKAAVDLNLKESEKNLLLYPSLRETPPYMQYMLNVSIPANFYVRSEAAFNSFEMQLNGDLRVIQEPRGLLEMYGNLDVPKGKYFQFEEFNIQNGRVEFVNPKELPQLDIYAQKKKYGYIFQLHVSGSLSNPVKEIHIFDSNSGEDVTNLYPETKDQIALLLFGVTFNELGGSSVLDKGQEVINQALISQIEREARRFIGLDEVRLESQDNLLDFRNRRLNQDLGETSLSLGKYLTPHLYLEYKTQLASAGLPGLGNIPAPRLSWEAGNQLYMEYRINRNWSISTFYEKRQYDKVKFDINWRYDF